MIKKGKGWRIGWRKDVPIYKGLIGAEDWAIELTSQEMQDFRSLLLQIHQSMLDISNHLMEEETIVCEVESELMWLGAQGYSHLYSVRIIIFQSRKCEGTWSENIIQDLIQATQSLEVF
ncbi:DUF1818 family protein [Geminocystis sp. NIES-3709]|uniref:DUF1818 family protein n=1 Tax=Geminocystis sp. NIES-3709 TaxID=1617448 RepID=UPI0005FC4E3E|nr:DUF1818 family protein [Geminocystis sp. NIES-3709]BAQ66463.1 hypothetical protein GM3709_3228 [Geminocystis sp. NIES-3709]